MGDPAVQDEVCERLQKLLGLSKAADLRKFIYWAVTQGQSFGKPLLFQPLPVQVQAFAFREIKKIQS